MNRQVVAFAADVRAEEESPKTEVNGAGSRRGLFSLFKRNDEHDAPPAPAEQQQAKGKSTVACL